MRTLEQTWGPPTSRLASGAGLKHTFGLDAPSANGPNRACQVLVTGRVQGVGFRWHAREQASRLGLAGWTRNLADGRVELHLEGREPALRAMLDWLARGPSAAQVHAVRERELPPQGLTGFEIEPDGMAPA